MPDQSNDPVVKQFRDEITDNDLVILDAINRRVSLVGKLFAYKKTAGYDVVDQSREDWMMAYVTRANRGPLSPEAVREFWTNVLDLSKREAGRLAAEARAAD